jgi:hypothetical protein
MTLLDRIQNQPFRAALALGVLLGVAWGLSGPLSVPPAANGGTVEWRLPPMQSALRDQGETFAGIRQDVWGAGAAVGGRAGRNAAVGADWKLLGIVSDPQPMAIVLPQGGKDVLRLGQGQGLPDGSVILEIGDTLIRFEREGCRYQRRLFSPAADPEPDCDANNATDAPANPADAAPEES